MLHRFDITQPMVDGFITFTADRNALHVDDEFARRSRFRRRVVHGMLPFSHLIHLLDKAEGGPLDIAQTETRFLKPIFVGDKISLELSIQPNLSYEAVWRDERDSSVLIRSKGTLVRTTGERPSPSKTTPNAPGCAVLDPLAENNLGIEQLADRRESFRFRITPAQAQHYRVHLLGADPVGRNGASVLNLVLLSTLVGMRLPGRFATFSGFQFAFGVPPELDHENVLQGTVTRCQAQIESIEVTATVRDGSREVGTGKIAAMVNPPPRPGVSCREIRERHTDLGLRGKAALVVGASRGIGAATAKLLAMHGMNVAVNYFRGRSDADLVVEDIASAGGHAIAIGCDVSDESQVTAMFARVKEQCGGLDVLVNGAVRDTRPAEMLDLQWTDFLDELEVSLKGLHLCCREAVPMLRARGGGKIVNLSTIYVDNPVKSQGKYITAKSAVVGYSRSLARELAGENIQVNVLSPNMTETDLLASLPAAIVKRMGEQRPAGRNLQPIEVAQAVAFLASPWSSGMTGQKLVLNLGEPPFA